MRWSLASLVVALVIATACAPLVPASSSPTPAATIARRTAAPVTVAPAPRTAPPSATAVAAARPSDPATPRSTPIIATPRPTIPPLILNVSCAEWPSEVTTLMTQLALPPSMCLLRTPASSVGRLACTVVGCVPVTAQCAEQGSCVETLEGTTPHYVLLFMGPPASPPPPIGELYAITRHLCHLHQERTLIDLGRPAFVTWLASLEGREFESAFAFFRSAYPTEAARWQPLPSDMENYADVCAAWYFPPSRDQRVGTYLPLTQFAQKWLPQ